MYSMVLMMAVAGSGDVSSFGGKRGGCHGAATASCCGTPAVSSCGGREGLFAKHKAKKASCCGTTAAPVCCAPVAVAAPVYVAPAPVYVAPVAACAPVCCPAPAPSCGCSGGRVGFFAKHKAKKEARHSCCGAVAAPVCCSTVSVASPCAPGAVIAPPAAPAKEMPKPADAPKKKDS